MKTISSHGTGEFRNDEFRLIGENVVFEAGVLVFHPENIIIGEHVYIGHYTILKGYHKNKMIIGSGTWIGQQCFLHSAGGLTIGENVGIGPSVKIITSHHDDSFIHRPILHGNLKFSPVIIEDETDVGIGAIILPGVKIGRGVQIGAGAVVTSNIPDYAVVAGVPARIIRHRA